jgi:hypothetical protein
MQITKRETIQRPEAVGLLFCDNRTVADRATAKLYAMEYTTSCREDFFDPDYARKVYLEARRLLVPKADKGAAMSAMFDELKRLAEELDAYIDEVTIVDRGEFYDYDNKRKKTAGDNA